MLVCRLFGFVAPHQESIASFLGTDQLHRFSEMARLHDDGWGTAWLDQRETPIQAQRSPASGWHNAELDATLTTATARARIVHLRLASEGMDQQPENTHPFVADGFAFAHNGAAVPEALMEPLIRPDIRSSFTGTTDSERYFGVIRSRVRDGMAPVDAAAWAVQQLRSIYSDASLNALLLTPEQLIIVHASSGTPIPYEDFDSSGIPEAELPLNHRHNYYTLWSRTFADGTYAVTSSGLDTTGWDPLPADSVTSVDIHTGAVESISAGFTTGTLAV